MKNDKSGFEILLDSLGEGYFHFTMDRKGNFLSLSDSAVSVFESEDEDKPSNLFNCVYSERDQKLLESHIYQCTIGNKVESLSISAQNSKGDKRILDIKLTTNLENQDDELIIQGLAHDVTEKTIVNDALYQVAQQGWKEKGEEYFKSLVYFLGETFSLDYVIIDRLLPGHKAATVGLYSHGSVQPELEYDLNGTPCENVIQCSLCVYKNRIQELFPTDVLLQEMNAESYLGIPLWDSNGEVIGLIAILNEKPLTDTALIETVLQIVAVRTAHEMERKRDEEALKEREKHLRTTLNSIGEGVITTDEKGLISSINPVAERMLGFSREKVLQLPLIEIFHLRTIDEDVPLRVSEIIDDIVIGGQPVNPDLDLFLLDSNGEKHRISNVWSPLLKENGNVFGVVVTFRDIGKEYELQQKLIHAQKMDAIGQLAGGVAHDFNNMLSGIMNCAVLLQSPKRTIDEKGFHYADLILQISKRAADLTSKLLAFGRKSKQITEELDIHGILDECAEILKRTIDRKIKIEISKSARCTATRGDGSGLLNCFLNLGINAGQAMPGGGVLELTTENLYLDYAYCSNSPFDISPGEYCHISVKDTGCGISEDNLKHIFDPFFTTKDAGQGTGLGLAAVYGIICEHNGAISAYSEPGEGTVFNLFLPCNREELSDPDNDRDLIGGRGLILLVDDESFIRSTVSDLLVDLGFDVLTAEDGLAALDVYGEKMSQIDIVILDMVMPNLNGIETFKKLKEINGQCKVILTSGFAKENELGTFKDLGIFGFIKKPYDIQALRELISQAMAS